jgi:PilZ domain
MGWKPRQYPRFKSALPIELRPKGVTTPLRAQTTDIGRGGCYVEMMFTQEVSTLVDITLWVGSSKISALGEVVSKHPSFGNGFKFTRLTKQGQAELNRYLDSLNAQARTQNQSPFAGPVPQQ